MKVWDGGVPNFLGVVYLYAGIGMGHTTTTQLHFLVSCLQHGTEECSINIYM